MAQETLIGGAGLWACIDPDGNRTGKREHHGERVPIKDAFPRFPPLAERLLQNVVEPREICGVLATQEGRRHGASLVGMFVAIHVEERMPQQRLDELVARRGGKLRVVHEYLTLRLCANRHGGALADKLRTPQIPIATPLRRDIGKRIREQRDRVADIGESRVSGWERARHESLIFLPWLAIHGVASRRLAGL